MNGMKLFRDIVCGLCVVGSISYVAVADMEEKYTGIVRADGVTVESGWYDVD